MVVCSDMLLNLKLQKNKGRNFVVSMSDYSSPYSYVVLDQNPS